MNETVTLNYIEIKHEELPVRRSYQIDGGNYNFHFDHNAVGDFYTLMILDDNEEVIYSSKLTYLENSIQEVVAGLDLKRKIIPLNLSDAMQEAATINRMGISNFDNMRLCII
jgi:hypothetical protein